MLLLLLLLLPFALPEFHLPGFHSIKLNGIREGITSLFLSLTLHRSPFVPLARSANVCASIGAKEHGSRLLMKHNGQTIDD